MRHFSVPITISRDEGDPGCLCKHDAMALPTGSRSLRYNLERISSGQPVLNGRWLLTPDIDLADYRFEARFDWIDFAVKTNWCVKPGNVGRKLNNALRKNGKGGVYASSQLNRIDEMTKEIVIRLQDPSRRRCEHLFRMLEEHYGVLGNETWVEHRIWAWELAVDIFPRRSKARDEDDMIRRRIMMSELIRKHFNPAETFITGDYSEEIDWMRSYDGGSSVPQFKRRHRSIYKKLNKVNRLLATAADPAHHQASSLAATVYMGDRKRSGKFRLQDKCADQRKNGIPERPLDIKDRRTRIEITVGKHEDLVGDDVPETGIETIDDIASYTFDGLRRDLFDFFLPTVSAMENGEPDPEELKMFERTGVHGLTLWARGVREVEIDEKRRAGPGRLPRSLGIKAHNKGYEAFNRRVRKALQNVTGTFEKA